MIGKANCRSIIRWADEKSVRIRSKSEPKIIDRKKGLPPPGLGNCRARCSARCHVPCSSPRLRSGSCPWLRRGRIHPLPVICPPPAGGRPLYPIILPPLALRHNAKADPAGSCPAASGLGLPPVSTAGHMAVVAAGPRPLLSRVPRGHMPAIYTPAHLRHEGGTISNRRR